MERLQRLDYIDLIYQLEPLAYRFEVKPQEFWNSTYREMKLYVESRSSQFDLGMKQFIMLAENLGNKLIKAGMTSKKPENTNMIKDIYGDLFEEELRQQDALHPKASEGQDLVNLMEELGKYEKERLKELKKTNKKKKRKESQSKKRW